MTLDNFAEKIHPMKIGQIYKINRRQIKLLNHTKFTPDLCYLSQALR